MGLKWIEGAEGEIGGQVAGSFTATAADNRTSPGTKAMLNPQGYTLPSLGMANTWTVGFGLKVTTCSSGEVFRVAPIRIASEQCALEFYYVSATEFRARIVRGATTVDDIVGTTFSTGQWYYFEFQVTLTTGGTAAYSLKVDEAALDSGSNLNLTETGSAGADSWMLDEPGSSVVYVDDFYVRDDSTFLGDSVVVGIAPSDNGATQQWDYSTYPSHVENIDADSGDNHYVETDVVGEVELFEFGDVAIDGLGTVHGVQFEASARLDAAGSRTLRPKVRSSGGTVADGDDIVIEDESWADSRTVMETNPVTGAAWTLSDLNGSQYGMELEA